MDLRAHLFNDFISFAFSFCPQEICNTKNDTHYSGFMIFSYPRGTDVDLNVTDYLLKNNDIKIDNITINLIENIVIENNIFGYIYSEAQITNISGCENIQLLSSTKGNETININYSLDINEELRLKFENYNACYCTIE